MFYQNRIEKVRESLERRKLSSCIITGTPNIFYLTGLLEIEGLLFISTKEIIFFTTPLYYQESLDKIKYNKTHIIQETGRAFKKVISKFKKVAFIDSEISFATFSRLNKKISSNFIPVPDFIKTIRVVKDEQEIKLIKKSMSIAKKVMQKIKEEFKKGMTELDVEAEIHYLIRKYGGRKESFPPIVASGVHSSHPHHKNQNRTIKMDEPIVIDMGVDFSGYKSDLTSTFFPGKIPENFKRIYNTVKNVQKKCEEFAKAGIAASEVHKLAVSIFEEAKLSKYFIHGLGHGVGIEVHENPVLSPKSKEILKNNMIFTIEPGIYIPKSGGIRFEKMIFLK